MSGHCGTGGGSLEIKIQTVERQEYVEKRTVRSVKVRKFWEAEVVGKKL